MAGHMQSHWQGQTAAVVHLATVDLPGNDPAVAAEDTANGAQAVVGPAWVERARNFAEPLLSEHLLDSGEPVLAHADGTAQLLHDIGAAPGLCAAAYLVYASDYLQRPEEVLRKAFGESEAQLVTLTRKLMQIQRAARGAQNVQDAQVGAAQRQLQTERVRKMLLAFSRDLRVVLLRLASRLQSLRWYASSRTPCPPELAEETLQVFAPLANRLGIWQIKWEMEDLSFRFLQRQRYQEMARLVEQTRAEREASVQAVATQLSELLAQAGLPADVQGRPKHLYSIWKKMQGKGLTFDKVLDTRALRVIVVDAATCYAALARVHARWTPVDGEFDDYIARPKPNGYQSLHTVVLGDDGLALEVQIRTRAMHEHAEHGVAAHWMYKEAGARGYAGVSATGAFEEGLAEARKAVLRELLAWERDYSRQASVANDSRGDSRDDPGAGLGEVAANEASAAGLDQRIYVFTPQATIVDLPAGATPVDFAYALHTDLGHRCRGARVDGHLVPLNTALASGQTVEVVVAKEGGPSMDWLNAELSYLASPRARAKVRAWFNTQAQAQTIARGREGVEKLLQRLGRTAVERQTLAEQLGFKDADKLFEVVGKDELSLRTIETLLRPAEPPSEAPIHFSRPSSDTSSRGGVLVVGMDSLLTTLARCCRPAPPDRIEGYVTRGRGVAVHRRDCSNLRQMAKNDPGRVIEVAWGQGRSEKSAMYPMDVVVESADRHGLLRDVSEVFAKDKINVTGVSSQTQSDKHSLRMSFSVEAQDASQLASVLNLVARLPGVRRVWRR